MEKRRKKNEGNVNEKRREGKGEKKSREKERS